MLLRRQHENRKHQLRRQKHLDEQALRHARVAAQRRLHVQRPREHALHQRARHHPAEDLADEEEDATEPGQRADQAHPEGDGWVEEAPADAEEDPGVDCEGEAE